MAPTQRKRAREDGGVMAVTTIALPRDLFDRVKIQAVKDRTTFRQFVEDAVRASLARRKDTRR